MTKLQERIERIKKEIPIDTLLADLGYDVRPNAGYREQQFSCDLHGDGLDRKPSARVYPESASWYCFACGKTRDAIDTVRAKRDLSFIDAIRFLEKEYGLPYIPWDDPKPLLDANQDKAYIKRVFENVPAYTDVLSILYSTLEHLTQEREIEMGPLLTFWEAGDQVAYKVQEGIFTEDLGLQVVSNLLERLNSVAGIRHADLP